jgi:hypothetical protein
MTMKEITPEQRLEKVAESLLRSTKVTQHYQGKGRPARYVAGIDTIAQTGQQLAEMVIEYLNGELESVFTYDTEGGEEIPF